MQDNSLNMCPPWSYPPPSAITAAIADTAERMRRAYRNPGGRVLVTFPYHRQRRAEFEREQAAFEGSGAYEFDWSLWPLSERPGRALTPGECAGIAERVNERLAAITPRAYAFAAASGPATVPAFADPFCPAPSWPSRCRGTHGTGT